MAAVGGAGGPSGEGPSMPDSDAAWLSQLCSEAEAASQAEADTSSREKDRLPDKLSEAFRTASWFGTSHLASEAGENRRTLLRCEYQDLMRESRAERAAAEDLQATLSAEMRQLRDQCQEQGRTVGTLAQRLSDARHAVTSELRGAASARVALTAQLANEEQARRALEEVWRNEEGEVAGRIEAAEQQLATITAVRDSLRGQLRASMRTQTELECHISAERSGRSELEVAGERELNAWSEHNSRLYGELRHRLQAEREEVDTWRTTVSHEVTELQMEVYEQGHEESSLEAQVQAAHEGHSRLRTELQAEACTWHSEVEQLREKTRTLDEECWRAADTARRCSVAHGACGCERAELHEEMQKSLSVAQEGTGELEGLEHKSKFLREELNHLREGVASWRADDEAAKLRQQHDDLLREIRDAQQLQQNLEAELEEARNRGIFCMGRRRTGGPALPLPPPASPPPTPATARPGAGYHAPDRGYQAPPDRGMRAPPGAGRGGDGHGGHGGHPVGRGADSYAGHPAGRSDGQGPGRSDTFGYGGHHATGRGEPGSPGGRADGIGYGGYHHAPGRGDGHGPSSRSDGFGHQQNHHSNSHPRGGGVSFSDEV